MTVQTDLPSPLPAANNLESALRSNHSSGLHKLEAELVFTQDVSGKYLSFYWQEAERFGLNPADINPSQANQFFAPVDETAYLERLQQILENQIPERLSCQFRYGEQIFSFELVISPILTPDGSPTTLLVMGSQQHPSEAKQQECGAITTQKPPLITSPQQYQKLLTQISRNIRRTLDLHTIWQQTVNGLGEALGVSRCIISPYQSANTEVLVVAEYRREQCSPLQGKFLPVEDDPYLTQALATLEPVVQEKTEDGECNQPSRLVVATYYKDQPNGLINLYQCGCTGWQAQEIELVREIAEQVGTAIAHANLYQELKTARQQAEEASRIKSEFLATTTHELRTPLNGMIGFLKLIIDGMADDPEEQQEFIQEAYRSALHLLNIINDILDIAKIEAGKMELELGQVKLKELLNHVEDFTKAQAQQKQLSFRIKMPAAHDDIIVYGNYQRLLQVMLNLVGNAIKFTDEGGVTVSAEIQKKKVMIKNQEFPGWVKVSVADTGIGVSLDKQDRLFQKFTQVDGSLTRQYGGTGLGLTISQKLVETMGGEMNFYSLGEGLGSTVTFTVPLYQEPVMISNHKLLQSTNLSGH